MPGGGVEQTSTKYWLLHDDNNRILLATFTAFALAAGSTVLWRTRRTSEPAAQEQEQPKGQEDAMSVQEAAVIPGGSSVAGAGKQPKNSRSKERRRRNKEPKEPVTKHYVLQTPTSVVNGNGKKDKSKNKALSKTTTAGGSTRVVPEIIEPNATPYDESRSQSTASTSTSRSSSLSMPKAGNKDPALLDVVDPALELEGDEDITFTTNITSSTSTPVMHGLPAIVPTSRSDTLYLSTISNSSSSSSSGSQSQAYPPTPPGASAYDALYKPDPNSSSSLQPTMSMYPHHPTRSPSRSPNRRMSPSPSGSWDYDQIPSLGLDSSIIHNNSSNVGMSGGGSGYRKPPRFRSKSRGASGPPGTNGFDINPNSTLMQSSVSYTPPPGYTTAFSAGPADNPGLGGPLLVLPSGPSIESEGDSPAVDGVGKDKEAIDEIEVVPTFTFPTLNPSPSPSSSPGPSSISRPASSTSSRPKISTAASHHYHRSNTPSSSSHASSPLRTPTPSQSPMSASYATSGSAVSAQTQLASLRGALEAARLREEKAKQDADRLGRECADLKWRWGEEAGRWRAREGEVSFCAILISQVTHLIYFLL